MASSSPVSGSFYEVKTFIDTIETRISFDPDAFPAMEEPIASATHLFQELHEPGIKNEDERSSPAVATSTDTVRWDISSHHI